MAAAVARGLSPQIEWPAPGMVNTWPLANSRGSRAEVKEEIEAIEEMHKVGDTVKVPHKGKMVSCVIKSHVKGLITMQTEVGVDLHNSAVDVV